MTDKATVRKQVKARLAALGPQRMAAASAGIASAVEQALLETGSPALVGAFVGVAGEPDTRPTVDRLVARGIGVALPRVTGPGTMQFHQFIGHDWDALVDGPYGLREPPEAWPEVAVESLEIVLVPGLSFAADGSRLGHGGGYYDRALTEVARGARWGLCIREALVKAPSWTVETHDVAVGRVLTA